MSYSEYFSIEDLLNIFGKENVIVIKLDGEKEYTDLEYLHKQYKEMEADLFLGRKKVYTFS